MSEPKNMDPFNAAPDFILDLIFLKLSEEDLHETLRVSKSWFWASIRRTKKLKITRWCNPLKSMVEFYNKYRPPNEVEMKWLALFGDLVLDELVVSFDEETTNYLVNNGCNTAKLTLQTYEDKVPVTLESLRNITRLQSFEYCTEWDMKWHAFIIECLISADFGLWANNECPIEKIELNSNAWESEDAVLLSVTKVGVRKVTIAFLRKLIEECPNLEEVNCSRGAITKDWRRIFPSNVKRIKLHHFNVDDDVATLVDASTDAGRGLLPYLCRDLKSVELFHFDGSIDPSGETVYEAFPQQPEEVFICKRFNAAMNLKSTLFQSREIRVECDGQDALQLEIPQTKSVKLQLNVEPGFNFSPRAVCLEPGKVEDLSLKFMNWEPVILEPFGPNSFEGFSCLTSLTLSRVGALAIIMALDQCPSIKKLKLKESTIGSMGRGSSYPNVNKLVLEECPETMDAVFERFPCLSVLKQKTMWEDIQVRNNTAVWLQKYLDKRDVHYGLVFESIGEIRFMVSDGLQASLSQAQKLLNEYLPWESVCYLKGFKLIPQVPEQKVIDRTNTDTS